MKINKSTHFWLLSSTLLCIISSKIKPVHAEKVNIPTLQPIPEIPENQFNTNTDNSKLQILPSELPSNNTVGNGGKIKIKTFIFKGNKVISKKELDNISSLYLNKLIDFSSLNNLVSNINKLYIDRGYITSGAFIPGVINGIQYKFNRNEAIIPIFIIEGTIEDIKIIGSKGLIVPVKNALEKAVKPVLNKNKLQEAIQLLQVDPKIKNISVSLDAGSETGKSILIVDVTANKSFSSTLTLDNDSNTQIGRIRRGIDLSSINLTGLGDSANFAISNTDGSTQLNSSYTLPVREIDGTLGISFSYINDKIINTPFKVLDIISNAKRLDLSYTHDLLKKADLNSTSKLTLGTILSYEESGSSFLSGTPLPIPGGDTSGSVRALVWRVNEQFTINNSSRYFYERGEISVDLPFIGTNSTIDNNYYNFLIANLEVGILEKLPADFFLNVRGGFQWATNSVISSEQLNLGGQANLLGLQPNSLTGDTGAWGSLELFKKIPLSKIGEIEFGPYLNAGFVNNLSGDYTNLSSSSSALNVGIELQIKLINRIYAKLAWGSSIINNTNLPESSFSFSLLCKVL